MSFHLETIAILDKTAAILENLVHEIAQGEDARFAAAKLRRAADALRLEPLNAEDIRQAREAHRAARESLISLYESVDKAKAVHRTWIFLAIDGWQSTVDLLHGLSLLHTEIRLDPESTKMGKGLRGLLPASWWGGK